MTLSKLSLRNAKRQAGDYLVYFVSIVIVAALIYAFNGLVFSKELQELSRRMVQIPPMIILASIVVVLIMRWLVSYTINFMFMRRSREFGTYILIGVENKQVARLFFLENLAVGGFALIPGLLLGSLLFQALRAIIFAMFRVPYHFSLSFSMGAVGLTLIYFVFIYLSAQMKSRKRICRMKIGELLCYDRQNEGAVIKTSRKRRLIFTISIVLGILGTLLMMAGSLAAGLIGAGCIIVFLYGFFLSFASGVPAFFDKRAARKYQGCHLLVFRTLTAKLAAMGIIMATISMLFVATIISEETGMLFRGIFTGRARQNGCFDVILSARDAGGKIFTEGLDYIEKNIPVKDTWQYNIYLAGSADVMEHIEERIQYYRLYEQDTLIRESDYRALRAMLGYPPAELEEGQYLIHCQPYIAEVLKDWQGNLRVGGEALGPGGVHTEIFAQHLYDVNGNGFILVVPDETAEDCPVSHTMQVFLTEEPVGEEQYRFLAELEDENGYEDALIYVKAEEEEELAVMTAMTVFPLYYLALVLTMTAATILTIQQLSETGRYQRQFGLLQKLGMEKREMKKALGTQFAVYYVMPAIPPVLIGIPFILNLAGAVEPGTLTGTGRPLAIAGISFGLFFMIYGIYIVMAYGSLKRNVLPE